MYNAALLNEISPQSKDVSSHFLSLRIIDNAAYIAMLAPYKVASALLKRIPKAGLSAQKDARDEMLIIAIDVDFVCAVDSPKETGNRLAESQNGNTRAIDNRGWWSTKFDH